MSFTEVWGFDPDSAMKAQGFVRSQPELDNFAYSTAEERAARIPCDADSEIYELRRMYRLCFRWQRLLHVSPPKYSPERPFEEWPPPPLSTLCQTNSEVEQSG
jgi:hypothetical protein